MLLLEVKSGNTRKPERSSGPFLMWTICGQKSQILQFSSYWKSLFHMFGLTAIAQCWVTWYQQDIFSSNRLPNIMKRKLSLFQTGNGVYWQFDSAWAQGQKKDFEAQSVPKLWVSIVLIVLSFRRTPLDIPLHMGGSSVCSSVQICWLQHCRVQEKVLIVVN